MKRRAKVVAVCMVMVLLTVVSRAAASFTVAQVVTEQPQARKIEHKVTGDGVVEKLKEQPVYAPSDVLVDGIHVRSGQKVKKGSVLARLNKNSLNEKIQEITDEIRILELQNQALDAAEAKKNSDREKAKARAKEDYDDTVAQNNAAVDDAKADLKNTKKDQRKEQAKNREDTLKTLKAAVKDAKKAYEEALAQQKDEELQARRTVEDAAKESTQDYSDTVAQIELNQKKRKLDAAQKKLDSIEQKKRNAQGTLDLFYSQKWDLIQKLALAEEEEKAALQQQIDSVQKQIDAQENTVTEFEEQWEAQKETVDDLADDLATAQLQQQAKKNEEDAQKQEQKKTLARAQEDYNNIVEKNNNLVSEAEQKWKEAKQQLEAFQNVKTDTQEENSAVDAAEKAVKAAREQRKEQKKAAKRALEDAKEKDLADNSRQINAVSIAEKDRQLIALQKAKENGGKVTAPMSGTVTAIQVAVGEKTADTAAFLLSDSSGGMRFTTTVSADDAVYVSAGDTVSLFQNEKEYENMEVLATETNADGMVEVTVYVPKKTLPLGAHASMEYSQLSEEYPVTVSLTAVHTENEKYFVYTMEKADTLLGTQYVAKKVPVTLKEKNGSYVALANGDLSTEDQVITDADQMLSAGETVRLQEGSN